MGKQIITQYTGMGALREANSKHTSGVKTIVFSQKVILVQDFLEKKGEWGLRSAKMRGEVISVRGNKW